MTRRSIAQARITQLVGWLGAVALATGLSGSKVVSGQEESGESGLHRANPCLLAPEPLGQAKGIERRCGGGSSSGIAKGDFNGDGVADLAIGIPGKDVSFHTFTRSVMMNDAGAVQVIYGTAADGLLPAGNATTPASVLLTEAKSVVLAPNSPDREAEPSDQFGFAVAAGDFDHDGFSDLAVGIPGERAGGTTAVGAVAVFKGSSAGLGAMSQFFGPSVFASVANPGNPRGAFSLTWGDFNNDTFGDLAVASEFTTDFTTQQAQVTVLFGSLNTGLSVTGKQQFVVDTALLDRHSTAGLALTAGDFNRDGFFDLVAGAPFADAAGGAFLSAGRVHILPGSGTGLSLATRVTFDENSTNVPSDPNTNEQFGAAFGVGDFNGDTFDDLAIGVPFETATVGGNLTPSSGGVVVIPGSFFGLQSAGLPGASLLTRNGQGGFALAAGDFDGDGIKDLAIGAPNGRFSLFIAGLSQPAQFVTSGLVEVVFGTASGLSRTAGRAPQLLTQQAPATGLPAGTLQLSGQMENGDAFGSSLTAWNFGHSSRQDLAIGVPFEAVGTLAGAGAVNVAYGVTGTGLSTSNTQIFTENTAGLNNAAFAGDHFGLTVY
jgi:hypothetical protein